MKISKLHLSVGVLILLVGCVILAYMVPTSNNSSSEAKSTTQESSTEYMASQYKKIQLAAKKHNVVVVTYDKASYSKTFVKMVKETAQKYPDTRVIYIKNDGGNFTSYYSKTQNASLSVMGKIPNTNIFILEKGKTIDYVIEPHALDQFQIDKGYYSKTATVGRQPIDENGLLSGDTNKNNIYLLKHIDTDPEAKQLIQTGVIDFSFNYLHHDN